MLCGSWVELIFVENIKKKKTTQKKIYGLNNEKIMKTFFYCFQKNGF